MSEVREVLKRAEEVFLQYVDEIDSLKISDVAIRRALKKYDVKNLKINNVTPLRAKKMHACIIPKYQNGVSTDKSWLQNQRRVFIWCTICYLHKNSLEIADLKNEHFYDLQKMFPFKEIDLIKFQVFSLIKKDNKNSSWKYEEDQILKNLIGETEYDAIQWSGISKSFFIRSEQKYFRNAKQCRERWLNHLDPNKMKGKWQCDQDIILLKAVLERGKKWSQIVLALNGRKNEHMIKNRYKSLIHKKQKQGKLKNCKQNDIIQLILQDLTQQNAEHSSQNGINLKQSENQQQQQLVKSDETVKRSLPIIPKNVPQAKSTKCVKEVTKLKKQISELSLMSENINALLREQNMKKYPEVTTRSPPQIKMEEEIHERQLILLHHENENEEQELELKNNQLEIYGNNKTDNQFYDRIFQSVNTPVAGDNGHRYSSIILDSMSPANFIMSPYPPGWTPTIFFMEDHQGQTSPQVGFGSFCSKAKNDFHKFVSEDNVDQNQKRKQ